MSKVFGTSGDDDERAYFEDHEIVAFEQEPESL